MDQVYFAGDLTRAGSYAEYLAIDERIVANMPRTLTFEECAGLPLTALTAWEALVEHIGMTPVAIPESVAQTPTTDDAPRSLHAAERKRDSSDKSTTNGKHLLLVGGAGGVGSIAIQIASAVCGVPVVATASRPESRRRCLNLGAEHVLDHGKPLTPQLKSIGIDGVDYVFTTADLMNFGDLVETLNPLGHICTIQGGEGARTADLNKLKTKRGTFSYEYVFTRPVTGWYPEKQGEILATVAQLIDTGTLKSTVEKILPWERVEEAHRQIDSKHTLGKVVLRVPND
jgi:NADPH:quinone reductase-like Zn-dependent oxidoreductase